MSDIIAATSMKWPEHQEWERNWWGDCCNTYNEETKQYIYANRMGLDEYKSSSWQKVWDFKDKKIIDMGGGPTSMLLKSKAQKRVVVDPCNYPKWVAERYVESGIDYYKIPAEDFSTTELFDIALCYNVLQHVISPEKIIKNMLSCAKEIRLFEWVDIGIHEGHPHDLKREKLDEWLGGYGQVTNFQDNICYGTAYFGIFLGKNK